MASGDSQALDVERLTHELRGLPLERRLGLLADLHAPTSTLTAEQRRMQRAIYRSLDDDPAFLAADRALRDDLVRAVLEDGDLRAALTSWRSLSDGERRRTLEAVAAAQARVCGAPVPEVSWDDEAGLGRYHSEAGALVVGEAQLADRGLMLGIIFHVGAYHCQDAWVERRRAGPDPGPDALGDAVRRLAAFRHRDAWVSPSEDAVAYRAQPCEALAWAAARHLTHAVLAGLRRGRALDGDPR